MSLIGSSSSVPGGGVSQADLEAALAAKADTAHGHVFDDISGLQAALAAKADEAHGHSISDIADLQAALDAAGGGVWGSIPGDIEDQVDLQIALAHKSDTAHGHDISAIVSGMAWNNEYKSLTLAGSGLAAALMTLYPGTALATKYALKITNSEGYSFGFLADGSLKVTEINDITSLSSETLSANYLTVFDSVTDGSNNLLWLKTNATQAYKYPLRLDFKDGKIFRVDGTGKLTAPAGADIFGLLTIDQSDQATGAYEALSIIGNNLFGNNGIKLGAIGGGPAIWLSDSTNLYLKGVGAHSMELRAGVNSSSYLSLRAVNSVKMVDSANHAKLAFSFTDDELQLLSQSSLGNDLPVGSIQASMPTNTEAARTGLLKWMVRDYNQNHEAIRVEADGSQQVKIGLYGADAVAQAVYSANAETSHSLDASYNPTQIQDALNALALSNNELKDALVNIGIMAAS